jgi:aconitate hydratase
VLLKLGDKISTDDILPSGAQILIYRSNIPAIAEFCFKHLDPEFPARARSAGSGILVAGEHYGQGSAREHAAIAPMFLGVRAVLAKSFARIHRANLINWGIVPLEFLEPMDYDRIEPGERLVIDRLSEGLQEGQLVVESARERRFQARCPLTDREREILLAGGLLAHTVQMKVRQ